MLSQSDFSLPQVQDPQGLSSLVIRTDFSDDEAWRHVCELIQKPYCIKWTKTTGEVEDNINEAWVELISDRRFEHLTPEFLGAYANMAGKLEVNHVFLVDERAMFDREHPILVVDLVYEPEYGLDNLGRTFRVIPSALWAPQCCLSIGNSDFEGFLESTDEDGVERGCIAYDVRTQVAIPPPRP